MIEAHKHTKDGYVYILKTIPKDRKCYGGFKFPSGIGTIVKVDDWNDKPECGGGIHGWAWGFWMGIGMEVDIENVWLVLRAKPEFVVNIDGKCKCKDPEIVFEGTFENALKIVHPEWSSIINADVNNDVNSKDSASGDDSKLSASGYDSKLSASGYDSQLSASGDDSKLSASGNDSKLSASGYDSQLSASGHASQLSASGDDSKLSASGNDSKLSASGDYSKLSASGNDSQLSASGNVSKLSASGNASQLSASGNASKLSASGYASQLSASGNASQLSASGNASKLSASGNDSVCMGMFNSKIRVGKNGVFAIAYRHKEKGPMIAVGKVGENGIKSDTWYKVDDEGNIIEFEQQ